MNTRRVFSTIVVCCGVPILVGVLILIVTSRRRIEVQQEHGSPALSAQLTAQITAMDSLLNLLERYQTNHRRLPLTLREAVDDVLPQSKLRVADFTYNPTGLFSMGGTNWVIATTNPMNPSELILGTLPSHIDIVSRHGTGWSP
jgi:hypothetical protein